MTADDVFLWANWLGVAALAIGVVCACALAISGKIRDDGLKLALAEQKTKTADAELKLEQLRKQLAPRFLGPEFSEKLAGQPVAHVRIAFLKDAPDTLELAGWIVSKLAPAGWFIDDFGPIQPTTTPPTSQLPTIISAHGNLSGVTIVPGFEVPGVAPKGGMSTFNGLLTNETLEKIKAVSPALLALTSAFFASLGAVSIGRPDPSLPAGAFRIVVGPKA